MEADLQNLRIEVEQARGTHVDLRERLEQGMGGEQFIDEFDGNLLALLRLVRLDPPTVAMPYENGDWHLPLLLNDAVPWEEFKSGRIQAVVDTWNADTYINEWVGDEYDLGLYWQGKRLGTFQRCSFSSNVWDGSRAIAYINFLQFVREPKDEPDFAALGKFKPDREGE